MTLLGTNGTQSELSIYTTGQANFYNNESIRSHYSLILCEQGIFLFRFIK